MAVVRSPLGRPGRAGSIDPDVSPGDLPAQRAKRPNIKVAPARPENRFVGPLPLAIGLVALAAIVALARHTAGHAEDPNYVRAKENLAVYELGRPELERNYDSPIYEEALAALANVAPGSISAGPAERLASDIKFRAEAFRRRVKAREVADGQLEQARIDHEKEFRAAYQRDLLTPKKDYPECNEGGAHVH